MPAVVVLGSIAFAAWAATAIAQPEPQPVPQPVEGEGEGEGSGTAAGTGTGSAAGTETGTGTAAGTGTGSAAGTAAGTETGRAAGTETGSGSGSEAEAVAEAVTPTSEVAVSEAAPGREQGLQFGSYGRILAGSDLRGGKPEPVAVVAYGPRIVEKSYLELDFQYGFALASGRKLRTVMTLAFGDRLFHDTGEFDAQPALRNFYAEGDVTERLSAWVGSRMYRGDDIYLFDYWPLDDQNTLGAGGRYWFGAAGAPYVAKAHVGWNRLTDPYQFQEIEVPDPEQGATTVTQLNRQRMVASATFEAPIVTSVSGGMNLRAKAHAELQTLPSGTRQRDDGTLEALPSDTGFTVGFQLSAFGFAPKDSAFNRHANLFARYSKGLAAFDELAPPTSFDMELKTYPRASELVVGLSANWDHALGNVMLGAVTRRFVDADRNSEDVDDGWEYAIAVRPLARAYRDIYAGADLSYQVRFPRGLNPTSQLASDPAILQIAPMVVWSPLGGSGYARPQLRLVYRAARLNGGARDLYAPDDPRHDETWVHFLGFQAEWWFNSASYR